LKRYWQGIFKNSKRPNHKATNLRIICRAEENQGEEGGGGREQEKENEEN
jgi:hypothetical protein